MLRYAAIDIGSNAVRLLIADILPKKEGFTYTKNLLIRVPVRLGDDAFIEKKLSAKKIAALVKTMQAFKHLMDVFEVDKYMACATSAMREAMNAQEVVKEIYTQADLNIQIIEGQREASIINANHIETTLAENKNYLYIDVGGGSTELSVFIDKKLVASKSFNIGTIRILDNQVSPDQWKELENWTLDVKKRYKKLAGIGTGGNINKLFRLSGEKEKSPLSLVQLNKLYQTLNRCSLKERMLQFNMKADRADVIIPACEIFLNIMKWTGVRQIYVPKVGMADGIINMLIDENLSGQKS